MRTLRLLIPFLFAFGLRAQTTVFNNLSVTGTQTVQSGGNLTLLSGSTFTFGIAGTTNSLLYITNAGGNVGALGLGAGLSVSGGNLVAGSSTSANPSAHVGPSVVNGSASTFMRSDAAPAIDLTATYPWTGVHSFEYTAVSTTSTKEYGIQVIPTLNQRNAALFSLIYGNETITQAGSGQQDLLDLEVSAVKKWEVDSTGAIITGAYKASVIGSLYGGTGTGSFAEGTTLTASSANTWTPLAPGVVNTIYTSGGTGALTSWQPLTTLLDTIGSTQGDILERGVSAWQLIAPGTAGQVLRTGGAAADPTWVNAATPPGSSVTHSVATYSNTTGGLEDTGIANITSNIFGITSSVGSNNGILFIQATASSAAPTMANFLGANVSTAGEDTVYFGQAESTANEGYLGFGFVGSGSASNYIAFGFYGKADVATLTYNGAFSTAGITATTAGLKTGVQGSTPGSLTFFNATSGNIQISPPTGALGTTTLTLPVTTGTLALSQAAADVQTVAAGTAYTLTASNADVAFGTTSPTVTLTVAGTYEISVTIGTQLSGASFAAAQSVSYNLRRQNNTPADLAGSTFSAPLSTVAVTTVTDAAPTITIASFQYATSATTDIIGIRGVVSATPSLGSVTCNAATISAVWLHP